MRKNLRQSIIKSFGRYIAIVAIIALGSSLFVGLLMTKSDMVATGQVYVDQQNMFDLRLVSTYGWEQEQLDKISGLDGVVDAEGVLYTDLIAQLGDSEEESVYRFYAIPETVNQIVLRGGRLPENNNECLADGFQADESLLGTTVTISETNEEDALEMMVSKTYTIVGWISTPLYMDMNRGTTSVGSGSLATYFYVPGEAFDVDYFTEIHLTIPGEHDIYSEEYNDILEARADELEPQIKIYAEERFENVKQEAEDSYQEGLEEYEDGLREFEEAKLEAEQELQDAYDELTEAEKILKKTRGSLVRGGKEIDDGWKAVEENSAELQTFQEELTAGKAEAEAQFAAAKADLDAQKSALNDTYQQAMSEIQSAEKEVTTAADAVMAQYGESVEVISARIGQLEKEYEQTQNAELLVQIQSESGKLMPYYQANGYLNALQEGYAPVINGMQQILVGYDQLAAEKASAEAQLAASQAEIDAGWQELSNAKTALDESYQQILIGWGQLEEAEKELADGWEEYEEGKLEAEQEIADAEKELADAKIELDDAREEIDSMEKVDLYILDRNSNVGYNSLDSSSDIVAGVSRVFPVFFLLVAALVCITTMTRMIDEERTQIGTLKALGYSNNAIISKYMLYAGSGAIIGCGLGVTVGSVIFPRILWQAYKIMLYIRDDIEITFNWVLCGAVVVTYTAVMLFVTWYCCRRTLQEEPAELIRPKAPDAGKKIFMESLPFWTKISFLNKVTIRNIFRYRQRLAMMLVGIGGCTALLVTGFGLRDSIVNVVGYQFEEVTTYDLEVYFRENQTEEDQRKFMEEISDHTENVMFYHQSSVEVEFNNQTREVYMIASDDKLQEFIDMHSDKAPVSMPGANEVVLSVGVAEAMGVDTGDQIILRNADMKPLNVTVCGNYDNHVYNYAIVLPETIETQWNEVPEQQMAFVQVGENQDPHAVSAELSDRNEVMSVSVSEDLASMVARMMEALDLVVVVVVFCAGLLAVIVLYNLTNININERIREIATIKVLGFNAAETAAYVFKENITLTVIGTVVGLFLGNLLLAFVMSQVKIDMVWFKAMVMPMSYVWAVVLTILSACVVNFIFYFKLDKINMAEALKSVE